MKWFLIKFLTKWGWSGRKLIAVLDWLTLTFWWLYSDNEWSSSSKQCRVPVENPHSQAIPTIQKMGEGGDRKVGMFRHGVKSTWWLVWLAIKALVSTGPNGPVARKRWNFDKEEDWTWRHIRTALEPPIFVWTMYGNWALFMGLRLYVPYISIKPSWS